MRKTILTIALGFALTGVSEAQKYRLEINAETPEGALLQQIGTENDAGKKLALMEKFVAAHPKHDGAAWVYSQMVPAQIAGGNLAAAEKSAEALLAMDPDDLETAVAVLKAYEGVDGAEGAAKWSEITSRIARESLKAEGSDKDKDYARQVELYAEYALLNQANRAKDGAIAESLAKKLAERNPKSQYLNGAESAAFNAYRRAGQVEQAVAIAERSLARAPGNEEMLLVAADYYMRKNDTAKTLDYATKLVETMPAKPKPEGVSQEDWDKRKATLLSTGNWLAGVSLATQNKFAPADKALREALPGLTDEQMKAAALFHLGVANFRLAEANTDQKRIQDALRFSQEAAAIKGPYQANAAKNATAIRTKYRITKK
ncbi:MAG: hypothetical protein SFV18_18120 [Bryobacteraceae bacterium]|nr:hypothetical protein [Bryobacteraceae bacterium]